MRIVLILAILIITSCSNYRKLEPDGDRSRTDYFVSTTDSATKAANLPILRNLPLDDELTEIRIWVGFGPMLLQSLYSIRISENQQVLGDYIFYFDNQFDDWEREEVDEFYNETNEFCAKIGVFEETESCVVKLDQKVDWKDVYNNLNTIDIWNIPDSSEIPKYVRKDHIVTLDGSHIVVELKKKGFYRSFGHRLSPAPTKKKYQYGHKIMDVLIENNKGSVPFNALSF